MRAWQVHAYGPPREVLRLDELPEPEPGPGDLRVRVASLALNWNDLDGILGRYRTVRPGLPFVPGMEVVGTVDAAGAGAEGWVGRRVCAIPTRAFGGYAERAVCPAVSAFELPEELPDDEAAAIYFPFHLASLALFERGGLARGETVLIHAAAGGVGSAAGPLARQAGARVIATAGGERKLALCRELGADLAIDYRAGPFADAVNDATGGRGVDVVFDSVGGAVTEQSLRCMAYGARLLALGFASGIEAEDAPGMTPRPWLFANASLLGVCLAYVEDPVAFRRATGFNFPSRADGARIHERVLDLLRLEEVRPVIGRRVRFAELPAAFDAIERRETVGRTVVRLGA